MEKKVYITEEEWEKCRKVIDAFLGKLERMNGIKHFAKIIRYLKSIDIFNDL